MSWEAVLVGSAVLSAAVYVVWRALRPKADDGCDCAFKPSDSSSVPVTKP
jgi:hypothetical protein